MPTRKFLFCLRHKIIVKRDNFRFKSLSNSLHVREMSALCHRNSWLIVQDDSFAIMNINYIYKCLFYICCRSWRGNCIVSLCFRDFRRKIKVQSLRSKEDKMMTSVLSCSLLPFMPFHSYSFSFYLLLLPLLFLLLFFFFFFFFLFCLSPFWWNHHLKPSVKVGTSSERVLIIHGMEPGWSYIHPFTNFIRHRAQNYLIRLGFF